MRPPDVEGRLEDNPLREPEPMLPVEGRGRPDMEPPLCIDPLEVRPGIPMLP